MGYISPLNHSEIGLIGTNLANYLAPPCKYMTDSSPKYVEHVVKPASADSQPSGSASTSLAFAASGARACKRTQKWQSGRTSLQTNIHMYLYVCI